MKVICAVCNNEFEAQRASKKYCSNDCMNQARRERYAQKQVGKLFQETKGSLPKECEICGNVFTPLTASANNRKCCYECVPDGETLTRGLMLSLIKKRRGGKCEVCGYDRCIKALEFHHLDPNEKEFTISNERIKIKEAIEESTKCVMLCANCHREVHDNIINLEEI